MLAKWGIRYLFFAVLFEGRKGVCPKSGFALFYYGLSINCHIILAQIPTFASYVTPTFKCTTGLL
jgi:hypothetical protein